MLTFLEHIDINQPESNSPHIEDKPPQTKDNDCTCNAEKSVRFNLPIKTRTLTTRHENQKVIENTCKASGRYERKGNGNICRGNCKGSATNTCCVGKLLVNILYNRNGRAFVCFVCL